MPVPHFPFRFPQTLFACACASTLLRLPSHRTIRSWLARHSLSLACAESPSPAFPKQGLRSRPMTSLCLDSCSADSFGYSLSASTVPGFGANSRSTFRFQLAPSASGVLAAATRCQLPTSQSTPTPYSPLPLRMSLLRDQAFNRPLLSRLLVSSPFRPSPCGNDFRW